MMTRHAAAMELGEIVHREMLAGTDREDAAADVVNQLFPTLGERSRLFVVWALLNAETMYMRTARPALPAEGQGSCDGHPLLAPACEPTSDDGNGGQFACDAHGHHAPVSRRRLTLMRSGPEAYPIYVPGVGRKRVGDLTRPDIGLIYGDAKNRRRNMEDREAGWRRIYDKIPEGVTLSEAMDVLATSDKQFLASELGIEEWRNAA